MYVHNAVLESTQAGWWERKMTSLQIDFLIQNIIKAKDNKLSEIICNIPTWQKVNICNKVLLQIKTQQKNGQSWQFTEESQKTNEAWKDAQSH